LRFAEHAPRHGGEDRGDKERQGDQHFQRPTRRVLVRAIIPSKEDGERKGNARLDQGNARRVGEQHGRLPGEHLPISGQVERPGIPGGVVCRLP